MKRKSLWMGAVLVAMVAMVSAVAFAGFGSPTGSQDLEIDRNDDPTECICTANYEPVVCRAADGSRHTFSNLCVAGCNGYAASSCSRLVTPDIGPR